MGAGVPYAGWIEYGGSRGRAYAAQGRYVYPTALADAHLAVVAVTLPLILPAKRGKFVDVNDADQRRRLLAERFATMIGQETADDIVKGIDSAA